MFDIFPLFSSLVAASQLENDYQNVFESIKKLEFVRTTSDESKDNLISKNLNVLEKYPKLETDILEKFKQFTDNILLQHNCQYKITTSWITKCPKNSYAQAHSHQNSYYSGVFYFHDMDGTGEIEFENTNIIPQCFSPGDPTDWNIYNSNTWRIYPRKNILLFFPSYLRHRVKVNNSDITRYSLAFNIFPIGKFGQGDSFLNIK